MKSTLIFVVISLIAILAGSYFGYMAHHTSTGAIDGLLGVLVLSLLEASESMDNAVVDARILKSMDPKWRKRYITFGTPIAVLGMRFLFPVLVVSSIAWVTPWNAIELAFTKPMQYSHLMISAQDKIDAFGGVFLLLIALEFFINEDKDDHWIPVIEPFFTKISGIDGVMYGLTSLIFLGISFFVPHQLPFLEYGLIGMIAYILIKNSLAWFIGDDESANGILRKGISSFLYLEFIDASFSFDSVISAFAITTNPVVIAIGLGMGALVVRMMTLSMVKYDTLSEYIYVEHAAFYTILILSILMLLSAIFHIPECVTAGIGVVFIGGGFIASIIANKTKIFKD